MGSEGAREHSVLDLGPGVVQASLRSLRLSEGDGFRA